MKRSMTRIAGQKAELLLDFFLNRFRKDAIGLTISLSKIEDYSSSHRSASAKVLNRCTRPAATSRLALRMASCVSQRFGKRRLRHGISFGWTDRKSVV